MIYLIGQLSGWLFLTMAFAAVAGWAFAAQRAAVAERALRRDRGNLVRDLARLASGDGAVSEPDFGVDPLQSRADIREGRIAELERALEQARSRADEATSRLAELQRGFERNDTDAVELARLRDAERERGREIDVLAEPAREDEAVLQGWRLRYFEQRVRYLESAARDATSAAAAPDALPLEWRAREAEARAAHLEHELRSRENSTAPAAEQPSEAPPFAANADVDTLLRWRLLYLERRVAHLQEHAPAAAVAVPVQPAAFTPEAAPDPDRWKWRARYLEARVRHFEERRASGSPIAQTVAAPVAADEDAEAPPAPLVPRGSEAKPPVLAAARSGAADDLTLIDGLSLLQQSTFYSLGVFHFDQIAAWTPANVAWIDQYLRLRGRIVDEEWVEQAEELAREGPIAARRTTNGEDAWRG